MGLRLINKLKNIFLKLYINNSDQDVLVVNDVNTKYSNSTIALRENQHTHFWT